MTNNHQYVCKDCGYQRNGLLDRPAIGIGSYSTICPECGGQYESYQVGYSEEYDAYYNLTANEWIESKCDDPTCEYCTNRPDRPNNGTTGQTLS